MVKYLEGIASKNAKSASIKLTDGLVVTEKILHTIDDQLKFIDSQ